MGIRSDDTRPVVVADVTGGGLDDLVWGGGGTPGTLMRSTGGGGFTTTALPATAGTVPVVGDFNGDTRVDILWYGPGTTVDTLWLATS